jgi:Lrp/AsnC family transcriptional regulator for asnA, asnC and gidA
MKADVDDLDRAIVSLLQQDGRMSCAEIARSLGNVSARTVGNRIDRIVRSGLIKIAAVPNRKALGYGITADISIETAPQRVSETAEALAKLERISYVALVAGDRDVSIQANATDMEDLQNFITNEVQATPYVVRTKTYLLTRIVKDIYEWEIPARLAP